MLIQYRKRASEEKLRAIIRDLVQQGPHHYTNLRRIFVIIREEWAKEFYNDNRLTHNTDIREQFDASEKGPLNV